MEDVARGARPPVNPFEYEQFQQREIERQQASPLTNEQMLRLQRQEWRENEIRQARAQEERQLGPRARQEVARRENPELLYGHRRHEAAAGVGERGVVNEQGRCAGGDVEFGRECRRRWDSGAFGSNCARDGARLQPCNHHRLETCARREAELSAEPGNQWLETCLFWLECG